MSDTGQKERKSLQDVPERLRHVFQFCGIESLQDRFSSLPDVVVAVLDTQQGNRIPKSDLFAVAASRSGISSFFARKPELQELYTTTFDSILARLEEDGVVAINGDVVVFERGNRESPERPSPVPSRTKSSPSDTEDQAVAGEEAFHVESSLRTLTHRLPAIPELPPILENTESNFGDVPQEELLDQETATRLAVLTNETSDEAPSSTQHVPHHPTEILSPCTDLLNNLKTMIEGELGVEVEKRLDEISITQIIPGWSCNCTLSLEGSGAQLAMKAILPLVFECSTELLAIAESDRLSCAFGIATINRNRVLVIRHCVDLKRYSATEVRAITARALQEVVKIGRVIYDGERFRHKPTKV